VSTSELLLEYLKSCDDDYEKAEPRSAEEKELSSALRTIEIDSVEGLLSEKLYEVIRHVRSRKDLLEFSLDDHYSRQLLEEIPKIVKRALTDCSPSANSCEGWRLMSAFALNSRRCYLLGRPRSSSVNCSLFSSPGVHALLSILNRTAQLRANTMDAEPDA